MYHGMIGALYNLLDKVQPMLLQADKSNLTPNGYIITETQHHIEDAPTKKFVAISPTLIAMFP